MHPGERFDLALRVARFDPSPAAVEAAIEAGRAATAPGAEDRVRHLSNLGGLLQTRFHQTGEVGYLEEAIAGVLTALSEDVDEAQEASLRNNAGMLRHTQFQHARDWDVLTDAVQFSRTAVAIAPDGPLRADYQRNLAVALSTAFTVTRDLDLLEEAIEEALDSVEESGDDADRGLSLHFFAFLARRWFEATGEVEALDQAIDAERRAVDLTPAGFTDKLDRLALLGHLLDNRHRLTGDRADLAELVDVRRTLVMITPSGHPSFTSYRSGYEAAARAWTELTGEHEPDRIISPSDRSGVRSHHAVELTMRFNETGDRALLDRAVEEAEAAVADTSVHHPQRSERLDVLASALLVRAEADDDRATLVEGVALHREAVATMPAGHPYESRFHLNLGAALGAAFHATGELAWLTEAAEVVRRAVDSATKASDRATALSNLAVLLYRRATTTGEFAVLTEAIAVAREGLRIGADVVAGHANHLSNLGAMVFTLWRRTGQAAAMNECIKLHEAAVQATPERHPHRPRLLDNLGGALIAAFERYGDHDALDRGIDAYRAAVLGCDPALAEHAGYLANLGGALRQRSAVAADEGVPDEEALAEAIDLGRRAAHADAANPYRRGRRLTGLGKSLHLRFVHHGDRAALAEALDAFREAAAAPASPTDDRVTAAELWGTVAAQAGEHASAAEGFAAAVRLLPQLAGRRLGQGDAQYWLGRFANLAADAAACSLTVGNVEEAVTLLELGRGVLAAQAFDGRSDLTDLRERAPELADRFAALSAEIESDTPRDRLLVADELAAVTAEVRALPGLERFLRPPLLAELTEQAHEGPVVLVNVSRYRCDALILTPSGVLVENLVRLTESELRGRVEAFRAALAVRGGREERLAAEEVVHDTLEWLWDAVTGPVLDRLGPAGGTDLLPRLWWAPVGVLSLLPLHAAGHLRSGGPAVADRVVSSVTPTVRALGHARSRTRRDGNPSLLVVAVPESADAPDLPGAREEAEHLVARVAGSTVLSGPDATRDRVLAALRTSTWAHFACHGYSDADNPSDSHLALTGAPLHVLDVSRLRLDHAEFAYLSACDTARTSALLSDEAIHPASAFLIAGFAQVVGTLWEIHDALAPRITESIYEDLLAGTPDARRAPFAVHRTVGRLREHYPGLPSLWAAYVHAGA
ncbi:CHAT domain-containing protein [Saccharothrix sp. NRRL B-16314]|uniref:CHAT domain-containing protein n=1 Tax=Saccharothrix sp. NRRL B-16314 TaxID=1463825 RepID=UPI000525B09B|nr:CHAT domain-containing protein [Saccharothrix sp. NRRL B-16314]